MCLWTRTWELGFAACMSLSRLSRPEVDVVGLGRPLTWITINPLDAGATKEHMHSSSISTLFMQKKFLEGGLYSEFPIISIFNVCFLQALFISMALAQENILLNCSHSLSYSHSKETVCEWFQWEFWHQVQWSQNWTFCILPRGWTLASTRFSNNTIDVLRFCSMGEMVFNGYIFLFYWSWKFLSLSLPISFPEWLLLICFPEVFSFPCNVLFIYCCSQFYP